MNKFIVPLGEEVNNNNNDNDDTYFFCSICSF